MSAESMQHVQTLAQPERIARTLAAVKAQQRAALIPFVTAGYPSPSAAVPLMHAMVQAGADVIELGVPFSDPSADGPVIQKAGDAALAQGVGLAQVLAMVAEFRATDTTTPVVLMGYANPIERYNQLHAPKGHASASGVGSPEIFVQAAQNSGVDGLLVVDYPPEACTELAHSLRSRGMDLIFLLAPTSTERRIQQVAAVASGYVYYVSLKGVTGAGHLDVDAVAAAIPRIKQHVSIPVGVGFGIRDAATAKAIGAVSDAVVIGSKVIQLLEDKTPEQGRVDVAEFLLGVRAGLNPV